MVVVLADGGERRAEEGLSSVLAVQMKKTTVYDRNFVIFVCLFVFLLELSISLSNEHFFAQRQKGKIYRKTKQTVVPPKKAFRVVPPKKTFRESKNGQHRHKKPTDKANKR